MKIALIQQPAAGDRAANRDRGLKAAEEAVRLGARLVCFAELAFDPFYPQAIPEGDVKELAETIPGPTTEVFASLAKQREIAVVLNIFERDGDLTYDTSPVIGPDGNLLGRTRMVHIPDYACFHERHYYAPGDTGAPVYNIRPVCDLGPIELGVAICYDRHYPEYMRALGLAGADLVVVPQAGALDEWPDGLFEAEMRIAAFQNGYFTALCNRVGKEAAIEFAGESFVCNPGGEVIVRAGKGTEEILLCDLDLGLLEGSNARRLFLRDRRPELYGEWLK